MLFTKFNKDPQIKISKYEDLITLPKVIYVRAFTEDAAKSFAEDVYASLNTGQTIIPIVIDSFGGQVYSLMSMIDTLKAAELPVATVALGKSMSCGAALFTFGSEGYRFIAPNATLMIHEVALGTNGKIGEIKADATEGDRLNKKLLKMMANNCKKPDNYFADLINKKGHADWFLEAKEAKKHNLANHIKVPKFIVDVKVSIKLE